MSHPRNSAQWWALYDEVAEHLEALVERANISPARYTGLAGDDGPASGQLIMPSKTYKLPYVTIVEKMRWHREFLDFVPLLTILNDVWWQAPDRGEIHSWPGWGALCDLCSESWVFYEEATSADA